jgi:hypothetical protein
MPQRRQNSHLAPLWAAWAITTTEMFIKEVPNRGFSDLDVIGIGRGTRRGSARRHACTHELPHIHNRGVVVGSLLPSYSSPIQALDRLHINDKLEHGTERRVGGCRFLRLSRAGSRSSPPITR